MPHGGKQPQIIGRSGSGPFLTLEGSLGHSVDLVTVQTGKHLKKEATIETIRRNLAIWMGNPEFMALKCSPLDLAIVAKVNRQRMLTQDVDNIAKVVLDDLKETHGDPRFLFHEDSQVTRLLIWKVQQDNHLQYNTDTVDISFRVYDPDRQMSMVPFPETM